jgi:hypothetical protein
MLRRFAILWIVYAATFAFVVGAVFSWSMKPAQQDQHYQQNETTAKPDQKGDQQHQAKSLWERTWDDAVALYTAVLTVFTGLLAVISGVQIGFLIQADKTARKSAIAATRAAIASTKQTKLAAETAERQVRAYVFLENGVISDKTQDPTTPIFNLVFENYGQTPTSKGVYWIDSAIGEINDERQFSISERRITEAFQLAPGAFLSVINFNDRPQQLRLLPEQAKDFFESKLAFFVFGCLEYTDAFSRRRQTSFRLRFNCDSAQHGHLANCNTGNEYT